jgi:transcriptional regulator with XRE-family HTH domain
MHSGKNMVSDPLQMGKLIEELRNAAGLGLRQLARMAGISATALSAIEKGATSPTLATLHKLLKALGTDFASFFSVPSGDENKVVFSENSHKVVQDLYRQYTFLLPKNRQMRFTMLREVILPSETEAEWEIQDGDVGGVILSGGPMKLEIEGIGEWTLRTGDSFYIKKDQRHRATNQGKKPLQMITVVDPPQY